MPPTGKRLGNLNRFFNRLGSNRLDPNAHPQNREILLRLKTFGSGSKRRGRRFTGPTTKLPFSVDDRTDAPASLYAATKRADELLSESYAPLFRLPQTDLRFFTVHCPWGYPDIAL